jgi:hypothetical protein
MKGSRLIQEAGIVCGFLSFFVLVYIFLTAFLSPEKSILISINNNGEANRELFVLMLILTPIVSYAFVKFLQRGGIKCSR